MKEAYGEAPRFHKKSIELIVEIDAIMQEYILDGYRLTIRQLYYQLVARDIVPNTVASYNNIVTTMTNGRLAGLLDWDAVEDRTRSFIDIASWNDGSHILRSCARSYHQDRWRDQDYRLFVVVEKEALAGVLERICRKYDIPLLAARGYPSVTTLREFAKERIIGASQETVILHLGDHDPSGIDMSRDLEDRLTMFSRGHDFEFNRIALNMDQILELRPPPNPAKITDARYESYRRQYGEMSWELDALPPAYLSKLVDRHVQKYIDQDAWDTIEREISDTKERLLELSTQFDED